MATIKRRSWTTSKGEQREAWVVRYADQDGVWRLKTFDRQREAKDWLPTAQTEVKARTHRPDSTAPTVSAACEAWIRRGEVGGKERSTISQRRQHVDFHILPLLGADTKLSRIDVETFRDDLLSSRSRPMAKKVMTSLGSILKQAKMGHLTADVESVETGGRHKKRLEVGRDIPIKEEVNALLKASTGYMRALLAVAVFCGLRMSEVRALRWSDVDLDATGGSHGGATTDGTTGKAKQRQLHVRQRADKWCTIGPLKSETSYRSIPLAPMVVNTLKEWRLACPRRDVKKDDDGNVIDPGRLDLVFPNGSGNVESLPNIWNRHLAPLEVAAGVTSGVKVDEDGQPVLDKDGNQIPLAKYGAHAFRHFFVSWLIDQGFNIKRISVLAGHSSPVVTLTIYSHLMPAEDDHEKFAAGELALVS